MSYNLKISKTNKSISGTLTLEGSKSISNRVLIIQAICNEDFDILNLSPSDDTVLLQKALSSVQETIDVGHAGTSFRFLTAYLSTTNRPVRLTGSERMLERPVGPLVECLRSIGADIAYLEKEGFPPLYLNGIDTQITKEVSIEGNVSSQFISALLLIAPSLPLGLNITLKGELVSRSYIELSLSIMESFGISYEWNANVISINPQNYKAKSFSVEADWSAASYYYVMAALSDSCDLRLNGLFKSSYQGDSIIAEHASKFGVTTIYNEKGISISSEGQNIPSFFENNFLTHPDIAQSISVLCAGLGTSGLFSGLQTLLIKETDRIQALKNELLKFGVHLSTLPIQKFSKESKEQFYMQEGKINIVEIQRIATYKDHRMALSFACLGIMTPLIIEKADVINKSYPSFWEHLNSLGFDLEKLD